jgi:hypothetical protein
MSAKKSTKSKKATFNFHSADVNYHEKIFRGKGMTFTRSQTGYSCKFETEFERVWITPSKAGFKLYGAFSKLKSYLMKYGPVIDFIPKSKIKYFDLNRNLYEREIKKCYCVDIKSAYLSALKIHGVISQEIYDYINDLPKLDRLRCLGMLATCKIEFSFIDGNLTGYQMKRNDQLAKYFFLACYEVGEIMQQIKNIIGENFLFYWVDGVFVTGKRNANKVQKILENAGYQHTTEIVESVKIQQRNSRHWDITLKKGGKIKPYVIPVCDLKINKQYLHTKTEQK